LCVELSGCHILEGFFVPVAKGLHIPGMILGETALSFLGLGLRSPIVSWGVMLQDCMNVQTVSTHAWLLTLARKIHEK
jgi:peptide/nickel transport system permease protein